MSLKRILPFVLIAFVLLAFSRTLGFWDDGSPFTAINHGDHKHYMPKEKDESISLDDCPTHPPEADAFLSMQCQIIRKVKQGNTTYFVPDNAPEDVPITAFPTRAPASGERISPQGKVEKAGQE
jgi:hypothetical protein